MYTFTTFYINLYRCIFIELLKQKDVFMNLDYATLIASIQLNLECEDVPGKSVKAIIDAKNLTSDILETLEQIMTN